MKIGVVDLDTSHPANWIPIERDLGHEVVGVWDGGSVHPVEYVRDFAKEHEIATVYDSLEQMAGEVDCAIIHGCNWDTHVAKARPFVEAGKSVLMDKPLAGNARDLKQFCRWAGEGARITGGSSLRFCHDTRDWLAQPQEERGRPHTVYCGCGTDEFNYAIHAWSLLCGILGSGIRSVRHLGCGTQRRIQVNWSDGKMGLVSINCSEGLGLPMHVSITTDKLNMQYHADTSNIYRALLEATLPYLADEAGDPPVPMEHLVEPELAAVAARRSWLEGDREVELSELGEDDAGYDGKVFAEGYRKAKYSS
ncbi:MAG: Gfo/Idh/MocA family oxidoreductase [Phycisphaerae bacterium]|jgi:hypothetical protein|nr:Gfo/Idh/MocA family oxidoreductase [Phycisphaerae bacterium]MDP7636148.1 Gfo/Idh/MocA family oxidoreductase [Phycisphaerae bacterium]